MDTGLMKTAVVTGAASGIGRATAIQLAKDGYAVALVDIDESRMTETLDLIESSSAVAKAFPADVCDPHQLGVMVREVLTSLGSPELLVNVAGIAVAATVLDTSDQDWNRVINTNLTGPFLLTRAVLPLMLDGGSGVIVNVASVAGAVGIPARAAYCASKAGLVGLTRAVAADYASRGVRCVAICPGTVETEWVDRIISADGDPESTRKRMADRQLDGRMGTPEEIAATIAFIASDDGRFFNGASVVVDGGMTAV
jgi:meso-butanediol dehydrogenase / (S,S)-butanediol dehydrogenase / diacetyl reductase